MSNNRALAVMSNLVSITYQAQCQQYRLEHLLSYAEGSFKQDVKQLLANQQNLIKRILKGLKPELRAELEKDLDKEELAALTNIFDTLADQENLLAKETEILKILRK